MSKQAALIFVLAAIVAGLWITAQPASARDPETFTVRIAARLTEDERIEFGLRLLDEEGRPAALLLAEARFFPLDVDHHRWLEGDVHFSVTEYARHAATGGGVERLDAIAGVKLQIQARMHPTRKLVEFALRHQVPSDGDTDLSGPLFPRQRFFPSGLAHHRWLFTSPLTFTVVFEDVGMMFAESTLEHADGLTDGNRYSHERPEIMRLIEQCMPIYEPGYSGVIGSDCRRVVSDYCDAVRDAQGCATYRRYLSEQDHSMDPG